METQAIPEPFNTILAFIFCLLMSILAIATTWANLTKPKPVTNRR